MLVYKDSKSAECKIEFSLKESFELIVLNFENLLYKKVVLLQCALKED
jgi:hypothetical protein